MKFDSYGRFLKSDLYQVVEVNLLFVTINVCLLVLSTSPSTETYHYAKYNAGEKSHNLKIYNTWHRH